MKILGIETSCDDTSVAVIENGSKVVAEATVRQTEIHEKFGGIVPEVASREHMSFLFPLLTKIMQKAKVSPSGLALLAVTVGPGLKGSLLVGVKTASTLSYLWNKKIVPVNHLEAHLYASLLGTQKKWRFPLLGLVASGGHTTLVLSPRKGRFRVLGETRDDAAGEAFDKIAKLLDLGYPGGPAIERFAAQAKGTPRAFLPRPMEGSDNFDFSFSGLKTAVKKALTEGRTRKEVACDAQAAIVDVLVGKLWRAYQEFQPRQLVLGGGVMANRLLRRKIEESFNGQVEVLIPEFKYSLDNAAMVAGAAYFLKDRATRWDNLKIQSDLSFAKL